MLRVARYRFRATFRRRWSSYVTLAVLIGLVGGLGLGAIAAARRTQSSFTTFLASTNPPDVTFTIYGANASSSASNPSYSANLTREIGKLPQVRDVRVAVLLTAAPLDRSGAPRIQTVGLAYPVGSVDGLYFTQDRVAVTQGRMANPDRPHEIMMTALAAQQLGFHLGQTIPYGIYTQRQQGLPGFGTSAVRPAIGFAAKLVGFASLSSEIVEDDVDRVPSFIIMTPALTKEVFDRRGGDFTGAEVISVKTDHGTSDVTKVEQEIAGLVPANAIGAVHVTAPVTAKADRSLKPIAIALGLFGGIALLAALFIATQAISRRLRAGGDDAAVLRALGADSAMTLGDGLMAILGAVVVGSLLAAAVSIAISPLSPLGPVRSIYPTPGVSFDWPVLGAGFLLLVVGLSGIALFVAYRGAPHRLARRLRLAPEARSKVAQTAAAAGLPVTGVVGVRMALESSGGRAAVPVRSALLGTAVAIALVVATITFGSSLGTLVSHPQLYGWNWNYMLSAVGSGGGNVPPQAFALLAHDRDVRAYSGISYLDGEVDGQEVPFLIGSNHPAVSPPILSGHTVYAKDQIVLGGATIAALHKHLGSTVTFSYGSRKDTPIYVAPTRLTIVGIATMPAVGFASAVMDHTSMGAGALLSNGVLSKAFQAAINPADPTLNGPNLALVRLRSGVSPAAGMADLHRIANAGNKAFAAVPDGGGQGDKIEVVSVQRPAEIVNYRSIGATPAFLVSALALGAVTALALTLVASVRQRRRDLALLKTLGFTQRQLGTAVAWQASVNAAVGIVAGIPVGIVVGRWLWVLFARQIYAVPQPTVPILSVVVVAVGALVLANLVAAIPARLAARTTTALMLRAE